MGDDSEISVEVTDTGEVSGFEVQIWVNHNAIDFLIRQLQGLKQSGDHFHLMSPHWGSDDLVINIRDQNAEPVHHLKITKK